MKNRQEFTAKGNPSVYRTDISEFDHPDARLIEDAPLLLARCQELEAENTRLKEALKPWEMLQEMRVRHPFSRGDEFHFLYRVAMGSVRDVIRDPIKIKLAWTEWRERFPQEAQ